MSRKYKVKFRLDGVLVEVDGVPGKRVRDDGSTVEGLEGAIANGRRLCLMALTKTYKGMTLDHLDGRPSVVGVETQDAWDD